MTDKHLGMWRETGEEMSCVGHQIDLEVQVAGLEGLGLRTVPKGAPAVKERRKEQT